MNGTSFYDLSHRMISNVTHIPLTTNIRGGLWETRERESHTAPGERVIQCLMRCTELSGRVAHSLGTVIKLYTVLPDLVIYFSALTVSALG